VMGKIIGENKMKKGTRVRCVNKDKDVQRWGSNDSPDCLVIGKIYTVDCVEAHSWHTKIVLKEFPGKKFGSAHFEEVQRRKQNTS